jgi:poly(A) polymerase
VAAILYFCAQYTFLSRYSLSYMNEHLQHPIFKTLGNLADAGEVEVYVIGGFVRDLFMKRDFKNDIDILVIGSGIAFAEKVAKTLKLKVSVFKSFGTAMLHYDNMDIEFVGARKESYRSDSRKPIVENGDLKDDQLRRDFTINAMALALNRENYGKLLDPFNGLEDIENKLIRTPLDPAETFSDDPLRMMRAIRFSSQLQFDIDEKALDAIKVNRDRIKIVSKERILDELQKIVGSKKPSVGFEHLFNTGLLEIIFPAMVNLYGVESINGKSHKDNFYHTLEVLDNVAKWSEDIWLRWAAIMHDIAKPLTKRFDETQGWTFHGHEDRGAKMVPKLFAELKLPLNEKMKFVQKLVLLHLRPIVLAQDVVTDSAVRRLLFEAGDDIDSLMTLCHADVTTKNKYKRKKYRENFEQVQQKLKDVEERDQIRNWQPPIDGQDIMEFFDIKPGRKVGIIKNAIREAILDGDISNNKEDAMEFMIKTAKSLGLVSKNPSNQG